MVIKVDGIRVIKMNSPVNFILNFDLIFCCIKFFAILLVVIKIKSRIKIKLIEIKFETLSISSRFERFPERVKNINKLIINDIANMIKKVKRIAKDPLGAVKMKDDEFFTKLNMKNMKIQDDQD